MNEENLDILFNQLSKISNKLDSMQDLTFAQSLLSAANFMVMQAPEKKTQAIALYNRAMELMSLDTAKIKTEEENKENSLPTDLIR